MQTNLHGKFKTITVDDKRFQAAKCQICGATMYPQSLLKLHLDRHREQRQDYTKELKKLQQMMAHMRHP